MPEPRMSAQLARLARKRGRLPALVTALGVGVLMAVQQLLSELVFALQAFFVWESLVDHLLWFTLPMALGVFLALWMIAPISDELTPRFVLTRAGLASASGCLLLTVVQVVRSLFLSIGAASSDHGIFGSSVAAPEGVNLEVFEKYLQASLTTGASTFIFYTPTIMLAGVLLWLWLREHPREYAVAGLIDEL